MRILITEDDAIGRKVLELFLDPFGQIVAVSTGEDALLQYELAHSDGFPFDLIFLDVGLPRKNGMEVLASIREQESKKSRKKVPVIMLTGDDKEERIAMANSLGITDYLLKPVEERRLLSTLSKHGLIPEDELLP